MFQRLLFPTLLLGLISLHYVAAFGQEAAPAKPKRQAGDVFKNSIGMELAYIPPGKFVMGLPPKEDRGNAKQVEVEITTEFYLGKFEVTVGQWKALMQDKSPWFMPDGKEFRSTFRDGKDHAVCYIGWDNAVEFCKRLSKKEGRNYRLPTEAEWEYACRAGTTTLYNFGDDPEQANDHAWWGGTFSQMMPVGNCKDDKERYAHLVGQKKPNAWGLHDMHGNVIEWCSDFYADQLPGGRDPQGPEKGKMRVLRGGEVTSEAYSIYSGTRHFRVQEFQYSPQGFRVVLAPDKK